MGWIKNFSCLLSKSPIRFCPENPIQTGRRAKRGGLPKLAIYTDIYIHFLILRETAMCVRTLPQ